MNRVAIFVDGGNFYHQVLALTGRGDSELPFEGLSRALVASRQLVRLYYYTAAIKDDGRTGSRRLLRGQHRFFSRLHSTPYAEVGLGRLVRKSDGFVQKGVDVAIAVDMLSMAYKDRYDVAVLITADSDLVGAVQHVQDLGKHVELAICSATRAHHLRQVCDRVIDLDQILRKLVP